MKTIILNIKIKKLIMAIIKNAIQYEALTGRKLGITGEIGEVLVSEKLKLKLLADPQTAGFDAVKNNMHYQIKSRRVEHNRGKIGKFSKHKFDYAILAVLDKNYKIKELYKRRYKDLEPVLRKFKDRNPSFSAFKNIAEKLK